jgi:hypothetical protein
MNCVQIIDGTACLAPPSREVCLACAGLRFEISMSDFNGLRVSAHASDGVVTQSHWRNDIAVLGIQIAAKGLTSSPRNFHMVKCGRLAPV